MERRMPLGPPILPPISVGLVNMSHKSEKLLICPYNKAHAILSYRMQNHLLKCRKQHQDLEWGFCVHNATHQMPVVELEYHQTHACVDRHSFQASRYTFEAPQSSKRPPMAHMDVPEPSEDWDDGVINTFDPKENAAKNSIIRGKHCVPPSERKAFRIQHRLELLKRMEEDSSSSLNVQEVQNNADQQDNILEPLRTPQELPKGFSFGRGSTRTDGAPGCPGVSEEMAKLSMNSDIGTKSEASSISGVEWLGLGRGKRSNAPTTTAVGAMGAWGRGVPKFSLPTA